MLLGEIRGLFPKIVIGKKPFHLIPQRNNCFFHTNGERSRIVLFHLAENSHRFPYKWEALIVSCSRLELVARSPALTTGYIFSRSWHLFLIFPRLALATYFPALGAGCIFSRAWHWLHVFATSSNWFMAAFGAIDQR